MVKINLLPWRDELRKKKQKDFGMGVLSAVAITLVILFFVSMYIDGIMNYQTRRNAKLQAEIAILDKKIQDIKEIEDKKNKLLTKIEVIQKLQESRPEVVHLFDELSRTTPEGVYITKFIQVGNGLTMDGKAESNARISAFMRSIDNSQWVNTSALNVIKGQGKNNGEPNDFTLTAKQGRKVVEKAQPGAGK
jgi:type IV pilus assembly protein PilN